MFHNDMEYCDPFDPENPYFWMKIEHLARYLYAVDIIKSSRCHSIVDVGCAKGYGVIEMAGDGIQVLGLDRDQDYIQEARARGIKQDIQGISFHPFDLENQKLEEIISMPVDLITSFETLEHINNPESVLKQYYDVLSPNGIILLSVPNKDYEPQTSTGEPQNPYHKQLFTLDRICEMITEAGFTVQKKLGQPYPNEFFNREMSIILRERLSEDKIYRLYPRDPEAMRYFAKLFAFPQKTQLHKSYSFLIKAFKAL